MRRVGSCSRQQWRPIRGFVGYILGFMGILDWILDPMVREFGQASCHRAIKLVVVKAERVGLQSKPSSEAFYKQ